MYRPGEEEYEADLDENKLDNDNQKKENNDEPKKHKIIVRDSFKKFTKQQIKDTILAAAVSLAFYKLDSGLNTNGIILYATAAFIAKKCLNLTGRVLFGKKHNIVERKKAAKFSDYVNMTISAAALVAAASVRCTPISMAVGIGGAFTLTKRVIQLMIKKKKINKDIDAQNREARRMARKQAREEREQNRQISEDESQNEHGFTR